jgi:hypothetical protein
MKERPIIFSAPMIRAILEGRKIQTRRGVRLTKEGYVGTKKRHWHPDDPGALQACPYGQPGDRLRVREQWAAPHEFDGHAPGAIPVGTRIHYGATDNLGGLLHRSSLFMPLWASRITLEITRVRIERLQDITEEDAQDEGIEQEETHGYFGSLPGFERLWKEINGTDSWEANPWVWVIEFRRIENGSV